MLVTKYRPVAALTLLEDNPRQIVDADFRKLCASITAHPDYFEARPCILSDRTGQLVIIAGNMRYRPRLGWIGYHPSLLPRHRGRSAVEWAIRMRDAVTGGTVFWLNAGIDRGDIIAQGWCFISPALHARPPAEAAALLWRETLQPMGIVLLGQALGAIASGTAPRLPQDPAFSTWEPSTAAADIYRPDALLLPARPPVLTPAL